jgi:hypothetical protein
MMEGEEETMSQPGEIVETAQDVVIEAVESEKVGGEQPRWHTHVALTTLIMALLAALGGLLAGVTANEALLVRTEEIIEKSELEGDRLYVENLRSKHELLTALGQTPDSAEIERLAAFERELRELKVDTEREELLVRVTARAHQVFAIAVTLLSLGITLGGMAIVVERKALWAVGLVFGVAGTAGVGLGVLMMLS